MQPSRCQYCGVFYFGTNCYNCGSTKGYTSKKEPSEADILRKIFDDIDLYKEIYDKHDS